MDHNVGLGFISDVLVMFMALYVIFLNGIQHIPKDTDCCVLYINIQVHSSPLSLQSLQKGKRTFVIYHV